MHHERFSYANLQTKADINKDRPAPAIGNKTLQIRLPRHKARACGILITADPASGLATAIQRVDLPIKE